MTSFPNHVAIIMDGNGRWAKSRRLPRTAGHKKGVEATKAIVKHAGGIGLNYLTLYAFSTENWSRSDGEIADLMGMLRHFMKGDAADLIKNNVRLRVIGARDRLENDIILMIESLENQSRDNTGLNLTIALDYGGRQEILNAVKQITLSFLRKQESQEINALDPSFRWDDNFFEQYLYTSDLPDPDLLIRTSGEMRMSNFLLWQCAYTEFVFLDKLWPDFTSDDFDGAIEEYNKRDRRFGALESVKIRS